MNKLEEKISSKLPQGGSGIENGHKKEQLADEETFKRIRRSDKVARAIDGLNMESSEKELMAAEAMLGRRYWRKMFESLNGGDKIVTLLTPTSPALAIKNLNDNIFGSQVTDEVIAMRRKMSLKHFEGELKQALSEIDSDEVFNMSDLNVEQNFKFGVLRLPKNIHDVIDASELLEKVCARVNDEMSLELIKMGLGRWKTVLADIKESKDDKENDELKKKKKKIKEFIQSIKGEGFRLNYGISDYEENGSIKDKVMALSNSMNSAVLNGVESGFTDDVNYGTEFNEEKVMERVGRLEQIHDEIMAAGNSITRLDGKKMAVFSDFKVSKPNEKSGTHSRYELNRNIIRDIRKNKLEVVEDNQAVLQLIKEFVKSLNIVDFYKPYFTSSQISSFEKEKLQNVNELCLDFKSNKNGANIKKVRDVLIRNEKDERFTSDDMFHHEAIKIDNCTYLTLDVLDVGVDQLQEYEALLQAVYTGELSWEEASLKAGDYVTNRLSVVREKIFKVISSYKNGILLSKDDLVIGRFGGDEFYISIDNDKISDEDLEALMFELKAGTNSRVIKTVISSASRETTSTNKDARLKEHLGALKKSEDGAELAKEIEEMVRTINDNFQSKVENDKDRKIGELANNEYSRLHLSGLLVIQKGDDFVFKLPSDSREYLKSDIENIVFRYKEKLTKANKK